MNYSRVRKKKRQKSRRKNRYPMEVRHRLGLSAKARAAAKHAERLAKKAAAKKV